MIHKAFFTVIYMHIYICGLWAIYKNIFPIPASVKKKKMPKHFRKAQVFKGKSIGSFHNENLFGKRSSFRTRIGIPIFYAQNEKQET